MNDKVVRRWRLEQLLHKQRSKQKNEYSVLFKECLESLGENTIILSDGESTEVYNALQNQFPFSPWARIDWNQVSTKTTADDVAEIVWILNKMDHQVHDSVFVLWSGSGHPVLQVELPKVIDSIDDILAVDFDTYIFRPFKFVIEFYHEGEVTIGFV
ncbi:hypothetical protein [Brevibacillus centrosporus]|jgi:hypothetical protein|uniref:CDI toxin immunity protein n=1 Tax=Brevibacillus centrosporus TaxID=54910 RepID=UPI002E1FB6C2|nr:hypothetical protein [Brevibacillus centrosporus]